LKPLKPCPNFKPGQFLHLAINEYDPSFNWPESRVFSIANSPTRRDKIRITFSVKGSFTTRMFNEVHNGDKVWLKLPYGNLTFPENENELFFIAGGTGITPFASFLEYAIDKNITTKIFLYYGVRSSEFFIFKKLLYECQLRLSYFKLHLFIEDNSKVRGFPNVNRGMLSIKHILNNPNITMNSLFYISGPPQMIKAFKKAMLQKDVLENKIKIDEWE